MFANHFHVEIAVGLDAIFVDFYAKARMSRTALSSLGKIRMT